MKRLQEGNINTPEYWDKVYASEIKHNVRREDLNRFAIIESLIPMGGKVLEVGCGKGEFYEYFKSKRPPLDYTGVDISKEAINYNRKNNPRGHFLVNEASALPFKDGTFKTVVAIEVLEHLDNIEGFSDEVKRVLMNGGKFLAITPNRNKMASAEHVWSLTLTDINNLFISSHNRVADPHIIVNWTKQELVVDFDDFSEKNHRMDLLEKLKKEIHNLKITLFTIPKDCSKEFCQKIAKLDWIELALHGDTHSHLECSGWTKEKTLEILNKYEKWGCFVKVFKAPYWTGSVGLYEALNEKGYILAQNKAIPEMEKSYQINYNSVHGHIQNICDNGLEEKFNYYKLFKGHDFKFISKLYE